MNDDHQRKLLPLLADDDAELRMLAQHFLCEGYAETDEFLEYLFSGWDRWGPDQAFPEFPMLSFVPISELRVEECCRRALQLVAGRSLVDPLTRCGGKLLEQVVRLAPSELSPHVEIIEHTLQQSKIFFRVSPQALRQRVALLDEEADSLAERLDNALAALAEQPEQSGYFLQGLHALEALRRGHPDYLHLAGTLAHYAPQTGPGASSFQLTLHSLIHFPQPGLETPLAKHLLDEREAIHCNATEALVRMGTAQAAAALVSQFPVADTASQRWIARGLQRLRAAGLAEAIAELRAVTADPTLWLMLLVAEVRQVEENSLQRIACELQRVDSPSRALKDALAVAIGVLQQAVESQRTQAALQEYLQRSP